MDGPVTDTSKVCAALVAAIGELKNPTFDGVNPHFNSRFVRLSTMLELVREVFANHGLAVLQPASSPATNVVQVQTVIIHASGQRLEFPPLTMGLPEKAQAIAIGSCITYARRYSLQSAIGLAGDEDDDGVADREAKGGTPQVAKASGPVRAQTQSHASEDRPRRVPASPTPTRTSQPSDAPEATLGAAKAIPDVASDSRTVVGRVTYVKATEGTNRNGNAYTKYRVGVKATDTGAFGSEPLYGTTFDRNFGATLTDAKTTGVEVSVTLKTGQYGDEIVAVRPPVTANVEADSDIPF